jgi:hypothetical protein
VPDKYLKPYRLSGADALLLDEKQEETLNQAGCKILKGDFLNITMTGTIRHNTQKLAETIIKIVREVRENL